MCLVSHVPVHADIALFSIAFFAHLSFSTLVFTLAADMFPRGMVGSVTGLVGFGSSMGGMLFNKFAGFLIDSIGRGAGYPMLFTIGSTFHIVGFFWIVWTIRDVRPITSFPPPGEGWKMQYRLSTLLLAFVVVWSSLAVFGMPWGDCRGGDPDGSGGLRPSAASMWRAVITVLVRRLCCALSDRIAATGGSNCPRIGAAGNRA